MLDVDRALTAEGLASRVLLQVHDELVLEVAPGERTALEALVRREMGGRLPARRAARRVGRRRPHLAGRRPLTRRRPRPSARSPGPRWWTQGERATTVRIGINPRVPALRIPTYGRAGDPTGRRGRRVPTMRAGWQRRWLGLPAAGPGRRSPRAARGDAGRAVAVAARRSRPRHGADRPGRRPAAEPTDRHRRPARRRAPGRPTRARRSWTPRSTARRATTATAACRSASPVRRCRPGCCWPTATPPPPCASSDPGCHLSWSLRRRHRQGRVRARVRRRRRPAGPHPVADPRSGARRRRRLRRDPRHRRRALGRRHHLGPRRRADAVHPVVLGGAGAATATATAAPTRQTSTTPRSRPRRYLCAGDRDLTGDKDRRSAVFSYNHSWDYVDLVLAWADAYATGSTTTGTSAGGDGPDCRRRGRDHRRAGPADRCHPEAEHAGAVDHARGVGRAARLGGPDRRAGAGGDVGDPGGEDPDGRADHRSTDGPADPGPDGHGRAVRLPDADRRPRTPDPSGSPTSSPSTDRPSRRRPAAPRATRRDRARPRPTARRRRPEVLEARDVCPLSSAKIRRRLRSTW